MEKTLLQPSNQKVNNEIVESHLEQHPSLQELTDEMRPFLDIASQQLLKPKEEVVTTLLRKISG